MLSDLFAAQEDADRAARVLLERGAELSTRCAGRPSRLGTPMVTGPLGGHLNGRFSGYTPLHYCAHYNAHRAARVLLSHSSARTAMEISDLNDRLPIHIAVARGSSDVLRELLHAGARVDMPYGPLVCFVPPSRTGNHDAVATVAVDIRSVSPPRSPRDEDGNAVIPPVSSPVLRSMIPTAPITSAKPWNCLTQVAIDECKTLISQAEQCWHPIGTRCLHQRIVGLSWSYCEWANDSNKLVRGSLSICGHWCYPFVDEVGLKWKGKREMQLNFH